MTDRLVTFDTKITEKFQIFSTLTGSLGADRIQLPVVVDNVSNFSEIFMKKVIRLSAISMDSGRATTRTEPSTALSVMPIQ